MGSVATERLALKAVGFAEHQAARARNLTADARPCVLRSESWLGAVLCDLGTAVRTPSDWGSGPAAARETLPGREAHGR